MLQESDIIPYNLTYPSGERIIVLAPHPDDETLGCGGTIRLLMESKKIIKVIFLTSGDKADVSSSAPLWKRDNPPNAPFNKGGLEGDLKGANGGLPDNSHITEYALLREKEAAKALKILGVSDYEFLRFPDREIHMYYKAARERLMKVVEIYKPDTIYSPSIIELNPDHRTTAELAMEIQRIVMKTDVPPPVPSTQMGGVKVGVMPIRLIFYEVTIPIRPNMLIDITSVYIRKKQAIKKYKSQLKLIDYLRHITALNSVRALTVQKPRYVEAFWCVDEPLSGEDVARWLSYL